uniref:Branched-chain amino acid ABC transporter substrate-binding protein n=1 Tax=candidate division WOR-3 bacterium TaxID=2052148 RepID=A0A7C4X9Q9_UNCW3
MKQTFYPLLVLLFSLTCSQEQVRIGIAIPLKGEQGVMAKGILQGAQLAVDEWNTRGGALGKKIVLEIMDDEANSERAVEVAKELTKKRVIGVIGHMNSHCSIAASEIYEEAGIAMITPSSTNPELTERKLKNVFRICGRDDFQAKSAADFIIEVLKAKTIYLINDHSVYSMGLINSLKEYAQNRLSIRGEKGINQGDTIFDDLVREIKSLNPDVVYFAGYHPEGARIVKQMREARLNNIFFGADGLVSEDFLRIAGNSAEGIYFTFGCSVEDLGSAQHFVRVYKEKYKTIDLYAPYAYDATNVLLEASCLAKERPIADVLHQEKFDGALGLIAFDEKGDQVRSPYMVWMVKDMKFVPWTKEL